MKYEGIKLEVNLLESKNDVRELKEWTTKNNLKESLDKQGMNLSAGDIITIRGGYYSDIAYTVRILGFDREDNKAYVDWECYWFPVDLDERLLQIHIRSCPVVV